MEYDEAVHSLKCPKCQHGMEEVTHGEIVIDRCTNCQGLWFDAGEVELLRNRKAAAAIDTGDAETGRAANAIDRYRCPRCSGSMVRLVDPKQPHIWYETCSACNGSFFDAGEFRDLSQFTLSDIFKRFSTPERT